MSDCTGVVLRHTGTPGYLLAADKGHKALGNAVPTRQLLPELVQRTGV